MVSTSMSFSQIGKLSDSFLRSKGSSPTSPPSIRLCISACNKAEHFFSPGDLLCERIKMFFSKEVQEAVVPRAFQCLMGVFFFFLIMCRSIVHKSNCSLHASYSANFVGWVARISGPQISKTTGTDSKRECHMIRGIMANRLICQKCCQKTVCVWSTTVREQVCVCVAVVLSQAWGDSCWGSELTGWQQWGCCPKK